MTQRFKSSLKDVLERPLAQVAAGECRLGLDDRVRHRAFKYETRVDTRNWYGAFGRRVLARQRVGQFVGRVVDRYSRQSLEEDAGSTNEGVRLALYFERKADGLNTAYDVLADRALLQVVQTATGISPATASQPLEKQAREIEKRIDLSELSDPAKLEEFLTRFTTLWEVSNPSGPPASAQVAALAPAAFGIDVNTLMSLQNIKYGGR